MTDVDIKLNTGEGEVGFITEEINGILEALLFIGENKVELIIESELGYTIFHTREVFGTQYIPIRSMVFDKDYHKFKEFGNTPYHLNEKLKIKIIGPINQEVRLILRII